MSSPNFIEHLHKHGKSGLFLTGIIFFTIGNAFLPLMFYGLALFIPLFFAALPIVGFWLIYAASKKPQKPEKTLAALTLFKIHTIINLVMLCLGVLTTLGVSLVIFFFSDHLGIEFAPIFTALLISMLIILLFIPLYYVPILKILESIKRNIVNNTFNRIRGATTFTIVTFAAATLGLVGIIVAFMSMGAVLAYMDDIMWWLMQELPGADMDGLMALIGVFMASFGLALIIALVNMVGVILCVITLNKLANSLHREEKHVISKL